jgi:DNA-binding NarL/FixJ family response regulator
MIGGRPAGAAAPRRGNIDAADGLPTRSVRRLSEGQPRGKRVMVVDGHAGIRELLVDLLAAEPGLEVVASAATGVGAIELADRLEPDVIVVDPEPAEVHGPDATRQILAQHPRTCVLVLTAAPHGTLAAQTLAAGAQTCLAKSVAYTAIVDAIQAIRPLPRAKT